MHSTVLVPGMTCHNCVNHVKNAVATTASIMLKTPWRDYRESIVYGLT